MENDVDPEMGKQVDKSIFLQLQTWKIIASTTLH